MKLKREMYKYLRESCALILSGISLYEGLKVNYGMIAVYGKGELVHTLSKHENSNTRAHLEFLLKRNPDIVVTIPPVTKGPVTIDICVPEKDGVEGLEKYLESFGFELSQYQNEKIAAKSYIDNLNNRLNEIDTYGEFPPEKNPSRGREIAAAVTLGHIKLTGIFGSRPGKDSNEPYRIRTEEPLDMGLLLFKSILDFTTHKVGLAYINGNLRILISGVNPKNTHYKSIWEMHPQLDMTKKNGQMKRQELELFFMSIYLDPDSPTLYKDQPQYVYLR